jgi:hypothetical protein
MMTIHLEHLLPSASRNQPGWQGRKSLIFLRKSHHPYSVLLPVGFAMPSPLLGTRCALTAPFHPYRINPAVRSLWHFPWGRPRRTLSGTVFPWSPDFPPPQPFGSYGSGHPANWQARVRHLRAPRQQNLEFYLNRAMFRRCMVRGWT